MAKNKFAIISDIHMGVHGDSPKWHETVLSYGNWLSNKLIEHDINELWILGDIFDNRKNVGVETIATATRFFEKFAENGISINAIVGNHDSFFEDNSTTSSLSILNGWKNVTVIDTHRVFYYDETSIIACPWGTTLEDIESDYKLIEESGRHCKAVFGHFSISSFADIPGHISTNGFLPEDITKFSDFVFSGHFHLRDERDYDFPTGHKKIIIVGSPFELNWNDRGSSKGVYIVNKDFSEIEFIENDFSPKHVQINASKDFNENDIKGNIVRVVANTIEEAKIARDIIEKATDVGVFDVGAKLDVVDTTKVELSDEDVGSDFNPLEMLMTYITKCDLKTQDKRVREILLSLYNSAIATLKKD